MTSTRYRITNTLNRNGEQPEITHDITADSLEALHYHLETLGVDNAGRNGNSRRTDKSGTFASAMPGATAIVEWGPYPAPRAVTCAYPGDHEHDHRVCEDVVADRPVDSITVEPMTRTLRQLCGRETDPNHLAVVHRSPVGHLHAVLHTTDDVHDAYAVGRLKASRLDATVLTRSTYAPTVVGADVAARVIVDPLTQPIRRNPPKIQCTHNPDSSVSVLNDRCGITLMAVDQQTDQRVFVTLSDRALDEFERHIREIRQQRGF